MSKKKDKSKIITASVVTFLCIVFVVGFTVGLNSVLAMEGAYPPVVNAESLSPVPETKEDLIAYLNLVTEKMLKDKPAVENGDSFSIEEKTVETDGSEALKTTLLYCRDGSGRGSFDEYLENKYDERTVNFSESAQDIFVVPEITADDIVSFHCGSLKYRCSDCSAEQGVYTRECLSCKKEGTLEDLYTSYIYYQCPSCGESSETPLDSCELCGGVQPYSEKYADEYEFTVEVDTSNDELMQKLFAKRTDEQIDELIGDEMDEVLTLNSVQVNYSKAYIIFKVKRTTNELTYLEYRKEMPVDAEATFINDYASLGNCRVSFVITEKNRYNFTWPGLSLSEHEMSVEPKGNNNLLATLTCDDATKYGVTWSSSDEEILTVDDEGYFKAGKKEGSAVVTASFEFNGKTYSDECIVNVKYSVESTKMSKKKLELNVGESYQLEVKFSPSKATVQTVKWYTDDEKIANIDENGVVTAVSPGVVTVYSLSDDGYFKSSCEVTVK